MAKKSVASLQNKGEGRAFSKVIKMVKSPKSGAYVFQEEVIANDKISEYLKK